MVSKMIEVTISPTGEIKLEAVGYSGAECEQATRALEEALGIESGKRTVKPERYQQTQETKEKASW